MIRLDLAVSVDGDGHFNVASLKDRSDVINSLKTIEDGDFWANEIEDEYYESVIKLSDVDWENWLKQFQTRGRLEFLTIYVPSE